MEETSHGYVSPESDTLIIKTKHGHMVEVTLKHPLYIQNTEISEGGEMIQAKKLSLGDKLRIQIGMKCYGKKSLSETDAKNIGIYHGNKLLVDNKLDVPNDILSANKKTFDCFMKGDKELNLNYFNNKNQFINNWLTVQYQYLQEITELYIYLKFGIEQLTNYL
jgi:hypothetical protein